MKAPINIELIRNPYNWVIVVLMIAIAGMAVAFVFPRHASNGATSDNTATG